MRRQYALSPHLRRYIRIFLKRDFRRPSPQGIVIQPFYGVETVAEAQQWLYDFTQWSVQEDLTTQERLSYVVTAMFGDASTWCAGLQLENATWLEFYYLFSETFICRILQWPGSRLYPYFLHFCGIARENIGRPAGPAGIGTVLTTPSLDHDCGHLGMRIGPQCTINVAEYEAQLIAGLEAALKHGVKHILAFGRSRRVYNHVTGTWKASDPGMKQCLIKVQCLAKVFDSFEIRCCNGRKYHAEAHRLARQALENTVLKGRAKADALTYSATCRTRLPVEPALQSVQA